MGFADVVKVTRQLTLTLKRELTQRSLIGSHKPLRSRARSLAGGRRNQRDSKCERCLMALEKEAMLGGESGP